MRNPHVPPWLLARREHQPELHLSRMLHGRAGAAAGQDPLEFRRKLMAKHPQAPRACSTPWPSRSAGASRRRRASSAGWPAHGLRQLRGGGGRRSRSPAATRSRSTASSPRPIPATRSTRRRSTGRSPARSSTACRRCSTGMHRQGRPHRARPTSTPTTRCASPRCRRSSRSSCRPAAVLGRRRRADDLRRGAGGAQCVLQGDRQAHPHVPAEEPRHRASPCNDPERSGGLRRAAAFSVPNAAGGSRFAPTSGIRACPEPASIGDQFRDNRPRRLGAAAAVRFPARRSSHRRAGPRVVGGRRRVRRRELRPRAAQGRSAHRRDAGRGQPTFTALPFSTPRIAGLRDSKHQQFGYDRIKAAGVTRRDLGRERRSIPQARTVTLADGARLAYDRLVLSPGIDFRWDAHPRLHRSRRRDHAACLERRRRRSRCCAASSRRWRTAAPWSSSSPANPCRCPPGPYERASLIAHYLKTKKPRSKLIVLDAKEGFSMQRLFEAAWKELYPGLLEWVGAVERRQGDVGRCRRPRRSSPISTSTRPTVANVIPPQKAGRIAELAGVADRTGWCPVDPVTFESRLQPNIHVIGDAAIAGAMPRSAFAANAQGKVCAAAIAALLAGKKPERADADQHLLQPDRARLRASRSAASIGRWTASTAEADGGAVISPADAPRARAQGRGRAGATPGSAPSPARCSDERAGAALGGWRACARLQLPGAAQEALGPTRSSATRFRSR